MTSQCVNIPSITLLEELKARCEKLSNRPLNIIMFGPPGSGKGTHSEWLKEKYNLGHISTGDALREEIASGSELGLKVKDIIQRGELVSDDIVFDIVKSALAKIEGGFLLDGFPRTLEQAKALEEHLAEVNRPISGVFYFNASDDTLVTRICGRWTHKASGRTYHTVNRPPKTPFTDDVTGEPLTQRPDDNEDALRTRLEQFRNQTLPLFALYKEERLLHEFDANTEYPVLRPVIENLIETAAKF